MGMVGCSPLLHWIDMASEQVDPIRHPPVLHSIHYSGQRFHGNQDVCEPWIGDGVLGIGRWGVPGALCFGSFRGVCLEHGIAGDGIAIN